MIDEYVVEFVFMNDKGEIDIKVLSAKDKIDITKMILSVKGKRGYKLIKITIESVGVLV